MQIHPLRASDILDFAAENHSHTEVVTRLPGNQQIVHSYATIQERARRAAGALARLGLRPGERAGTIAWNHHRHLELYYGIPGAGGVIHTINPRVAPDQIAYMIDAADDRVLFYDTEFSPLVERALALANTRPLLVELTEDPPQLSTALAYEGLIAAENGAFQWVSGDETEPFGLCFTSGTTGAPKGVQYTHRSTVLHAMACCSTEGQAISSRETVLPVVPMFHANAWGVPHSAPMTGARLVLPGRHLDGPSLLAAINSNGVTFLCGVPTVWQTLIDHVEKSGESFQSLRRAGIGGSSPSRLLVERIEEFGVEVFHAWGMTETNPFGGTGFLKPRDEGLPKDERLSRKLGQGRPVFGLRRRIVDEGGAPLPHDGVTPGRLVVQGNWVLARYVNIDNSPLQDGWFDTGDIASIDEDGYMVITDRAKDLIKSGGEWISSIDLENVAYERPEILHCAALGRPDSRWGERPVLVLASRAGATVDEEAILGHMKRRLPRWQVPEEIIVQSELPLTAAGKIDKKVLRQLLFS